MFNKEMAAQGVIATAIKTEQMCLKKDRAGLFFGTLLSLVMAPIMVPFAVIAMGINKLMIKFVLFTVHAFMCSLITLPVIFISLPKVGAMSMWYAAKGYHLFTGETLKVADDNGELYEFNEDRYEAWLRQAIASSK